MKNLNLNLQKLTWNSSGPVTDLFYKIRLVDPEGLIKWTIHKGNDDWWISTPDGDVDGHFISEETARKRCEHLTKVAGFWIATDHETLKP
jgi:hypothetical protein